MADLRRPSLRLGAGLAVAVLALVELQTLAQTMQSSARFRERLIATVRDAAQSARPRLVQTLQPGDWEAWRGALEEALASTRATEAELFDRSGAPLLSRPQPAPVSHWPAAEVLRRAEAQGVMVTVGPIAGRDTRLLTYGVFPSGDRAVVVRLSTAVPDLVADLRARRQLLLGHAAALLVLVVGGALALFPVRDRTIPSPSGLEAYEAAMERLREHGEERSLQHAAERRRMEDRFRDKEAFARAGELTSGIVHELRNGLATILGYARLLEHGAGLGPVEVARRIRDECQTLETVIRRFMEFVKRETLQLAPFDVARLLSRVVARESRAHPGAEVSLADATPVTVVGDEELLERAFENVVRNAIEAAGAQGHVSVEARQENGTVAVSVADDGPGLPPDARQALRPFFTTKPGGLGLGVAITLKIVELHQGRLELADNVPRGLKVTVRLLRGGPGS